MEQTGTEWNGMEGLFSWNLKRLRETGNNSRGLEKMPESD